MTTWLLQNEGAVRDALQTPWPQLQRVLVQEASPKLIDYAAAVARVLDHDPSNIEYCREQLKRPAHELNPSPLITGHDLRQRGIPEGAIYKTLLNTVRDAQLNQQITTQAEAWQLVEHLLAQAET